MHSKWAHSGCNDISIAYTIVVIVLVTMKMVFRIQYRIANEAGLLIHNDECLLR